MKVQPTNSHSHSPLSSPTKSVEEASFFPTEFFDSIVFKPGRNNQDQLLSVSKCKITALPKIHFIKKGKLTLLERILIFLGFHSSCMHKSSRFFHEKIKMHENAALIGKIILGKSSQQLSNLFQNLQNYNLKVAEYNKRSYLRIKVKPIDPNFMKALEKTITKSPVLHSYFNDITTEDRQNIRAVIAPAANDDLTSLWWNQNKLDKLGEKILHIHPLKLLLFLVEDKELFSLIKKIRARSGGIVWAPFKERYVAQLNGAEEITAEVIDHLSARLKLKPDEIAGIIRQKKWTHLIEMMFPPN